MVALHAMSNMNTELYNVLKNLGASEDDARAAAISVVEDNRSLRDEMNELTGERRAKITVGFLVVLLAIVAVFGPQLNKLVFPADPPAASSKQ